MSTIYGSVYDHPTLYDVLFSTSWKQEIEFLTTCFERYGRASTKTIFEPACGTGRLLWRLAKRGFTVSGLDLNPRAVAFCNRRLRRHGLPETAFIGDMTDFQLPKPVDAAFNLVSSFLHLTTETATINHFHAVANALKPNGLYLLGLHLHPEGPAICSKEEWTAVHGSLAIRSRLQRLAMDNKKRLETVEFRIHASTPTKKYELIDSFPLRTYSLPQFSELLKAAGRFELVETFDFSMDLPIRIDTKTEDVVYILRRTA